MAFTKGGFRHLTCSECGTLYISPRPTLDMLMDYYRTAMSVRHWNDAIFPVTEELRSEEILTPRMWHVLKARQRFEVEPWKFVDVGAGFGTFCHMVKRSGHFSNVIAVEPSHELAESCRGKGLEVLEGAIEAVDLESASVITAFELIEHLFSPRDFLKGCHKALFVGGLLILTTPNIKGFDLAMLGELSQNIGGPNHLQLFHPDSLRHLMVECGFEVLEWSTPGKLDADIVLTQIVREGFEAGPFLGPMLKDVVPREAFQKFLVEQHLSSHMLMIARKA